MCKIYKESQGSQTGIDVSEWPRLELSVKHRPDQQIRTANHHSRFQTISTQHKQFFPQLYWCLNKGLMTMFNLQSGIHYYNTQLGESVHTG